MFDYFKIISPYCPRNLSKTTNNIKKLIFYRVFYWAYPEENKKQNNKLNKLRAILIKLIGCSDQTEYEELCTSMCDKKHIYLGTHEWILVHIRR